MQPHEDKGNTIVSLGANVLPTANGVSYGMRNEFF